MTATTCDPGRPVLLDGQSVRSLVSILTDLVVYFDGCHGPTADAVNDHFDDNAAADWIPLVLADHARLLTTALGAVPSVGAGRPAQS